MVFTTKGFDTANEQLELSICVCHNQEIKNTNLTQV